MPVRALLPCFLLLPFLSPSQNCSAPPTGLVPVNDLGTGSYLGWTGGLYPGGSNAMPAAHLQAGLMQAGQVQCLDTNGNAAASGRIVWLSIGMSNTTQETQQFIPLATIWPGKNPKLTLVDGAQGGQTAQVISTPSDPGYATFWSTVGNRLKNAGVTAAQVQVIWLKEANQAGNTPYMTYYDSLVVQYKRIANELAGRFPNVKLCYFASRISARYATTGLNPEPYAYLSGWAVKHVIEDQINGDPQLTYGGVSATAPWLAWAIYPWSDGDIPQVTNPAVHWTCPADFQNDGTHPSTAGAQKVAGMLLNFFTTDPTATPWFLGTGCPPPASAGEEMSSAAVIPVFPNPSSGEVTIAFPNRSACPHALVVFDSRGRYVFSADGIRGDRVVVNTAMLDDGLYFFLLTGDTDRYAGKLMVGAR